MQENITWWQLRDRILQLPWRVGEAFPKGNRLSLLWAFAQRLRRRIVRSFFRWVPGGDRIEPAPEKRKRIPDLSAGAVWMSDDFDDPLPDDRIPGLFAGKIHMSDDFDDPLPDSFWLGEEET